MIPRSNLLLFMAIALIAGIVVCQRQSLSSAKNLLAPYKIAAAGTAPIIKARTLEDKEVLITYGNVKVPTVLYVFVPSCPWCSRNLDNIKILAKKTGKTHRFLGLALSDYQLQEYIKNKEIDFQVYKQLSAESINKLGLGSVPQTIVISPQGKILRNWTGAYNGAIRQEVEAFFRIKLSGMDERDLSATQFCPFCIWEGLINSPGKVIKVDGRKIRCKENGKWTASY